MAWRAKNPQGCFPAVLFLTPAEHTLLPMPHISKCSFAIRDIYIYLFLTEAVITS